MNNNFNPFDMVILFTAILVLLLSIFKSTIGYFDYQQLKKNRNLLRETVKKIDFDISDTENEIKKIKGSPDYAYKVLREKYHILEKNESIIFFQTSNLTRIICQS